MTPGLPACGTPFVGAEHASNPLQAPQTLNSESAPRVAAYEVAGPDVDTIAAVFFDVCVCVCVFCFLFLFFLESTHVCFVLVQALA